PATSQTVSAMPGVPTLQVITRALRNTPVPITFATLTEIAAINPKPRTSWPVVSFEFGVSSFEFTSGDYTEITQITQIKKQQVRKEPQKRQEGCYLTCPFCAFSWQFLHLCNLRNLRINSFTTPH